MGNLESYVLKFLAIAMVVVGALISIVGIGMLLSSFGEVGSNITFTVLLGLVPLLGGIFLFRYAQKRHKTINFETNQRMILEIGTQMGGRITPMELARHTSLTLEEAKSELDRLQTKGLVNLRLTEKGDILYEVKGLIITDEERKNSEEI